MPTPAWGPQPAATPTIDLTETVVLTVLRSFLLGIVAPGTEVIKGQPNRVAEPGGDDFIVMTPMMQHRLGTNLTTYADNSVTGSISGNVLTVTAVLQGALAPGELLLDGSWPMNIALGTTIIEQLTGTPGGIGTYTVTGSQSLSSETLYAGVRSDLSQAELTVQLDVHGPNGTNNARVIDTLFRSEYATSQFDTSGFSMDPLYSSDPIQTPFVNAEQQYEYRWTIDATIQVNVTVDTPQQFATEVEVKTVQAGIVGPTT